MNFQQFVQLTKIDIEKRQIWGVAAVEQPDLSKEIMDFEKSAPNFHAWSEKVFKASRGKSRGNVREMHQAVAVGKVIKMELKHDTKQVYVGVEVVDDQAWRKVQKGIYTGFSIGGDYGERWDDGGLTRYEAKPTEISLVDLPCMPDAQFEIVKGNKIQKVKASRFFKGESEGHPFRGNQHTGGKEGSGSKNKNADAQDDPMDRFVEVDPGKKAPENTALKESFHEGQNKFFDENGYDEKMSHALELGDEDTRDAAAQILQDNGMEVYTHGNKLRFETAEEQNEAADILRANGMKGGLDSQRSPLPKSSEASSDWTKIEATMPKGKNPKSAARAYRAQKTKQLSSAITSAGKSQVIVQLSTGSTFTDVRHQSGDTFMGYDPEMGGYRSFSSLGISQYRIGKDTNQKVSVPQGLKGENMSDLIKSLEASTDPEMNLLAQDLLKQFPPKKDEPEEKEGDPKEEAPAEEAEGETPEEEQSEETDPEDDEEFDGNEELDETEGDGQENPVRNEVIKVLEELGLIAPADQMTMAAKVSDLSKRVAPLGKLAQDHAQLKKAHTELQTSHSDLAKRSEDLTKDVAVVTATVQDLMSKGLPSPVLREIQGSALLQGIQISEYLQKMATDTQNPLVRQALLFEIQQIEIKNVQKGT